MNTTDEHAAAQDKLKEHEMASRIVEAILDDLRDRKGVGDELAAIEDDIMDELESDLIEIVTKELRA